MFVSLITVNVLCSTSERGTSCSPLSARFPRVPLAFLQFSCQALHLLVFCLLRVRLHRALLLPDTFFHAVVELCWQHQAHKCIVGQLTDLVRPACTFDVDESPTRIPDFVNEGLTPLVKEHPHVQ